jgi:hypothetical protein
MEAEMEVTSLLATAVGAAQDGWVWSSLHPASSAPANNRVEKYESFIRGTSKDKTNNAGRLGSKRNAFATSAWRSAGHQRSQ